jgi:hypothetical protein
MKETFTPTYFVVSTRTTAGSKLTVSNRENDLLFQYWSERFNPSDFPLLVVTAIPVTSAFSHQLLTETVSLNAVPDEIEINARTLDPFCGQTAVDTVKPLSHEQRNLNGKPLGIVESIACDVTQLCVSQISDDGCKRFLTSRKKVTYQRIPCLLKIKLRCWYDFPRCGITAFMQAGAPRFNEGRLVASKALVSFFLAKTREFFDAECAAAKSRSHSSGAIRRSTSRIVHSMRAV